MSSRHLRPIRKPNTGVPALAGAVAALVCVAGGMALSGFVAADPAAETARPQARQSIATRSLRVLETRAAEPLMSAGTAPAEVQLAANSDTSLALAPALVTENLPRQPLPPRIAVVIDDVGLDFDAARRVAALEAPVTVAVLPYAQRAAEVSALADAAGHDVLLHMPMEPVGLADPGPNALRLDLSDSDIEARLHWSMAQVPHAIGLNNHMGSRFTRDPRAMRVALSAVADREPLFLDSVTTGESRGRAVADGLGLRTLERDIFLDHVISADDIAARLDDAEALANERGWAVVIGHPHDVTLDQLESWIDAVEARGVELVSVSTLADQLSVSIPAMAAVRE